jgi:glycosyltransferase involved in cell wall biosynthesis
MKLLYLVPNINNEGGVARVLAIKTHYLIEKWNYQVDFLTQNKGGFPQFYNFNSKIGFHDMLLKGNPIQFLLNYKRKLNEQIELLNPDIIIVCDNGFKAFLLPFILKTKIPVVLEIHSSLSVIEKENDSIFKIIGTHLAILFKKLAARNFEYFVVETSESIKEWNVSSGIVIPNPLWFHTDQLAKLNSKKVIAVGRHVYEKGFDRLLYIWKKIVIKHPDWHLDIYGQSSSDLSLQKLTSELNLTNSVSFYNPTNDIVSKYQENSIYLMTSRFEGFGMVLIEAMASGLPCVAYDCPCGPRTIIENKLNGFLIKNGNESDYVEAVLSLINNESKRIEMGKKAKLKSLNYNIDNIMLLWDSLFKDIKAKSSL